MSPLLMADSLLSDQDLKEIAKEFATQAPKDALWTGEAGALDLFAGGQRNAEFIASATENFSKLGTNLQAALETAAETKLTLEVLPYEISPIKALLATLKTEEQLILPWTDPKSGLKGLLLLDRVLFFQFYCALYGGSKASPKTGKLSSLENSFFNRLMAVTCETFQEATNRFFPLTLQADKLIVDNEALTQLRWPFDCLKAVLQLTAENGAKGNVTIAMPTEIFQSTGPQEAKVAGQEAEDRSWIETVGPAIKEEMLTAPLSIVLGTFKIPLKQAMDLKVGDTFPLTVFSSGYPVSLNNQNLFTVSMGAVDGKRAIKVQSMA